MNVSVCNQGHFPEKLITQAEAETSRVFHSMDVEIVWAKCRGEVASDEESQGLRFIIRLRSDHPLSTAGPASLDAMGRAFVSAPGEGYLADVYCPSVQAFAKQNGTGADGLLGHVMAHELGHLLLGPGHSHQGIMQRRWNGAEAAAADRRWLNFGLAERMLIHGDLRRRDGLSERNGNELLRGVPPSHWF